MAGVLSAVVMVLFFQTAVDAQNTIWKEGRIRPPPSYLIAAPRRVRADEVVNVYVSVMKISYPSLTVRAAIRRNGEEIASVKDSFAQDTTKIMQMKIPESALDGNYSLRVDGSQNGGERYGYLFENETKLLFQLKRVSVFIQTDRPVYQKKEKVSFRVIAIDQDMLPVKSGSITIYIKDASGRIVRRFLSRQLYNGVYDDKFGMSHPAMHGRWTIQVHGWGYVYSSKFTTENKFPDRFWPNVTVPPYVTDNEFALGGVVVTKLQKAANVFGNATVELEIRPPGFTDNFPTIRRKIPYLEGETSFLFPLKEISKASGVSKLAGTQLITKAWVHDFYSLETIYGQAHSSVLDSEIRVKFVGGRYRTFKPGALVYCYIAVYESDGSPLQRERGRQLRLHVTKQKVAGTTSTELEIPLIIPDDSVVKYAVQTSEDDEMITVRVNYGGISSKYSELIAYRHYSENGRYIYVSTSTRNPKVNRYMVFTIRVSTYVEHVKYLITSGGRLITADTIYMMSTQKTISIALSRQMVPSARILVYCVSPNGEVLSDSLNFHVDGIRTDGTKVRINFGKDFTRDTVEINAFSDPGTFIAFSVLQYDQYKFSANRAKDANIFFTKYALEEELETYDNHVNNSFKHTWWEDEGRRRNVYFQAPSSAIDANTTFSFAGLLVFSDANVPRIPGDEICNYTLGYLPCFDSSCFIEEQRCDGVKQCVDGADEMGCPEEDDVHRPDDFTLLYRHWWHLEDPTWGWKNFYTKPYGRIDFTVPIPTRPSTWMVGAFALSVTDGLSFNDQPARLSTMKPLVCELEMPISCKKGEQIGVQVSVLSYYHEATEVLLTIKNSNQFKVIAVEDQGVVSSYAPRLVGGDIQVMVYLEAEDTKVVHFPVVPTVIGKVDVVIEADSFLRKYKLKKSITVEYDGVTNVYHTPYFINLVSQGSQIIPDLEIPVPEIFIHPEIRESLYVPGSPTANVSLVGDVLGAGFVTPLLTADTSMDLIVEGNGHEQMFTMAFNINWLRFLKATNQLSPDLMNSVLTELADYFPTISSFITEEGAFSERHKHGKIPNVPYERLMNEPDVSLTGFGLETLTLASQSEYEHILYVDVNLINKMALWLVNQQNKTTGAFKTFQDVQYNIRFMTQNLTDSQGRDLNISQTAFAVIGLTKSLRVLTGVALSTADASARLGANYLARHFDLLTDPFDVCLVTYALHVASHRDRSYAFQRMQKIKFEGEYTYWSPKPIPPNPTEIINTVPYQKANNLPLPWASRAIQATSYALMVYLTNNKFREAEGIVEWLQVQRQSVNAWVGTQDTIAAVQALREYGERLANRHLFDMLVTLESTSTGWWNHDVHLARGSFLDFRQYSMPQNKVFGSIRTRATGTGLALLQMRTTENVEYPWQMRQFPERSFDLVINKLQFSGRNASHMYMDVCVKWTRPDIAPRSGSVVLEVDIPTGFYIRRQTLEKIMIGRRIPARRFRFARQTVLLYMDYIDERGECYDFWGDRWYPVANATIQHQLRIVDTSEPGLQNRTMYTTYDLFHLHICQVCGSYQCPYCPFYNCATMKTTLTYFNIIVTFIATIMVLNKNCHVDFISWFT